MLGPREMQGSKLRHRLGGSSVTALAVLLVSLSVQCQQVSDTNPRPVVKLDMQVGGSGGTPFDDFRNATNIFTIQSIGIGSMYQVDFIQVNYTLTNGSLYMSPFHGDGVFVGDAIKLAPDEYFRRLEGLTNGNCVNELYVTTYTPKDQSEKYYSHLVRQP